MRTPLNDPFWERVKALIKTQKSSQEKLAARIGLSYGTLKHWICYGLLPDIINALKIAEVLGVSVEYLVWGKSRKSLKKLSDMSEGFKM